MTTLYIIEMICHSISAVIMIYFFNRAMPAKNKKYNKIYTIIMIIFYTVLSSNIINNIMVKIASNKMFMFIISCYILTLIYPVFLDEAEYQKSFFYLHFILQL